jgi:DNA-binding GntR family transcriptional regulator
LGFNAKKEVGVSQGKFVAEKIRSMIISGVYKSGERLVESDLAKDFKVSRTIVRESLKILEKEGFLENEPYKGMKVKKFTFREIKEYYEIRTALECLCVFLVVDEKNKKLEVDLNQNIALSKEAILKSDFISLVSLGNAFHKMLHHACKNEKLKNMLDNLRVISSIMRPPIWAFAPNRAISTIEEHKKIAEAIITNKKSLALKHMRCHIINSYRNVEKYLKDTYFMEKLEDLNSVDNL